MRRVELARTIQNRPLDLYIIGYPKPPDTAAEISAKPTYWVNCNVHGNEASGRETCFTMARQLATTEDPAILDDAEQDDGADHAVEQPGRPRAQPARQLDRAGPQPRPRADRAGRDQGAGAADPRLHAGRLDRQPRGRQRGPADPLRAPPERARAALRRGQVDGDRLDVRRRRHSPAGGWARTAPAATATRASCATPASLKNGISMLGEARAAAGHHPSGRGRHQLPRRTSSARPTATCGRTGRACGTSTPAWTRSWRINKASAAYQAAGGTRPHGAARLLPVAAHAERRREPERPAGRGHAARVPHPRSGPVRLLHHAGRLRRAAHEHQPDAGPVRLGRRAPRDPRHHGRAVGPAACSCRSSSRWAAWSPRCWTRRACCRCSRRRSATTATATAATVGGTVPATLSLTLGAPATLGAFTPGVAKEYVARHGRDGRLHRR